MHYITEPWAHQRKDVDNIDANDINRYALFYDMGSGKTKTAIDILRSIYNKNLKVVKTLIVCPIAVVENWKREFSTHSKVPSNCIQIVDGKTKPNGKKLKNAQLKVKLDQLKNKANIYIINTESVGNKNLWPLIMSMGVEALVIDESHRFKSYNATRTKALHKLCDDPLLKYRYILTGSPILQDALDIWSQYYILDPNILGRNFFTFRAQYFYDANASMPSHVHFPKWIPKDYKYYKKLGLPYSDDMAKLNTTIYKHASRVMKDDVLDLPPYISQEVEVEFSKDQERIYNEMRDDLVATLGSNVVAESHEEIIKKMLDDNEVMSADLAIVKTLRLMQITAGLFVNEDGETSKIKTNLEAQLKEMLEEICSNKENKVIIWTIFKSTYDIIAQICDELGLKYTFLTGLQDKDEKQANIDQFNNDTDTQVIIANQAAGGTGCNLTAANYDIYYSWDFSLEKYLQSAARGYRGGQTRKYTSYKLVIPNSISARSLQALKDKSANAEDILATGKEMSREEILSLI
jgi:SNF2 family DNA or RNA helicase